MVWLIIVCILLVVLTSFLSYATYNLLKKVEAYEDFVTELREKLENTLGQMKRIDMQGSFESDDEVGVIFSAIKSMVFSIGIFLNPPNENE